jgi:hypothetical protein
LPFSNLLNVICVPQARQLEAGFNLELEKVKSEDVSLLFDIYNNLNAFSAGLVNRLRLLAGLAWLWAQPIFNYHYLSVSSKIKASLQQRHPSCSICLRIFDIMSLAVVATWSGRELQVVSDINFDLLDLVLVQKPLNDFVKRVTT